LIAFDLTGGPTLGDMLRCPQEKISLDSKLHELLLNDQFFMSMTFFEHVAVKLVFYQLFHLFEQNAPGEKTKMNLPTKASFI